MSSHTTSTADDLRQRFLALCPNATPDVAEQCWHDVESAYREPHRHYHTMEHLRSMVQYLDVAVAAASGVYRDQDAAAQLWAVFYHDIVYDPRAPAGQNEARSTELALEHMRLLGQRVATAATVAELIRATATHQLPSLEALASALSAAVSSADDVAQARTACALFLDADLSALGGTPDAYTAYATGIRKEYLPSYGLETFNSGRAKVARRRARPTTIIRLAHLSAVLPCAQVLRAFLARPQLFFTEPGRSRLEASARVNLASELAQLEGEAQAPHGQPSS
jgi:predicted metal-dependent HD superfamily phosphohydrolase